MVQRCVAVNGRKNLVFVTGILREYKYLNILKNQLRRGNRKLGFLDFRFQRDNDPKYTVRIARVVKESLLYNIPYTSNTPPRKPGYQSDKKFMDRNRKYGLNIKPYSERY